MIVNRKSSRPLTGKAVRGFPPGDLVLKWDAPRQDKGKHGKFEALWIGPFHISEAFPNNTYRLQNLEGDKVFGGPVNGHFLKMFFV
jgi:hypothetical protein